MTPTDARSARSPARTNESLRRRRRTAAPAAACSAVVATMALLASCASVSPRGGNAGTEPQVVESDSSDLPSPEVTVAGPVLSLSSDLELCRLPGGVKNAPPAVDRKVTRGSALSCVDGVELLVAPAPDACMTSGFGRRSGRPHRGVDYQSKPAGDVVAAGAGIVREREFRPRLGNWIVIDHGNDVVTGYGHLASIRNEVKVGVEVGRGQPLGVMGTTGTSSSSVHLHYEIRRGDYDEAGSYFNLEPLDPFAQPESCVRDA